MTKTHTPGPWTVGSEYECCLPVECLVSNPGHPGEQYEVARVACFDGFPPGERGQENARLIAAAPDLLTACKVAADRFRVAVRQHYTSYLGDDSILSQLEAAISKATT